MDTLAAPSAATTAQHVTAVPAARFTRAGETGVLSCLPLGRRFTVDEYYRLGRMGVIGPEERVELIAGQILPMSPIGIRHGRCVTMLTGLLFAATQAQCHIAVQNPLRISDTYEPEPDLALVRRDFAYETHPGPSDVLLVVEVSDSTFGYDRDVKLPMYARAGVPTVWIVDLDRSRVLMYAEPDGDDYRTRSTATEPDAQLPVPGTDAMLRLGDFL